MNDDIDYNVDDFMSLKLVSQFRKKTSYGKILKILANDSDCLQSPSSFYENNPIIKRIYFCGSAPYENSSVPHLFDTIPMDPTLNDPVSQFCFPHGCKFGSIKIDSHSSFVSEVMNSPNQNEIEFFTQYFPTIEDAPYFYCCKFMGNPFSMPSICHLIALEDVFDLVTPKSIPNSEMCICIQSGFPDQTLFYGILDWILQSEKIGKYSIYPIIDSYLNNGSYLSAIRDDIVIRSLGSNPSQIWPGDHRSCLTRIVENLVLKTTPDPGSSIVLDFPPFPRWVWTRLNGPRQELSLSIYCLKALVSRCSIKSYIQLLTALTLEKSMLVYSKHTEVHTCIILAFHFMLHPLKWVSPSISILPDSAIDLLDSPSPTLIGTNTLPSRIPPNVVIFDADSGIITNPPSVIIPNSNRLNDSLEELWKKETKDSYKWIIDMTNLAIKDLISPIHVSIITDFSATDSSGSRFLPELFLKNFTVENRPFIMQFSQTQMMQFYIELECRKSSEQHGVVQPNH